MLFVPPILLLVPPMARIKENLARLYHVSVHNAGRGYEYQPPYHNAKKIINCLTDLTRKKMNFILLHI